MTPIEAAEKILRNIGYILTQYPANQDRISELTGQQQDLLHMIEFTPCDIQKGYGFTKKLQDVRRERRVLKDENEILKPLFDCLMAINSVAFKNGFTGAITRAKQKQHILTTGTYVPRSEEYRDTKIGG